jgi:hypothetical protein
LRLLIALLPLGFLAIAAAAEPALPPGYVEEPETPPEDPLPKPPEEFPPAPVGPVVTAPDAHDLLKACKELTFTDCFRLWKPPPPPPEEEKKEAKKVPLPLDPKTPRKPAEGGPLTGPPPLPNPEADQATYNALVRALKETGLEGKVLMPEPPKDGSTTLQLDPKSNKTAPKK